MAVPTNDSSLAQPAVGSGWRRRRSAAAAIRVGVTVAPAFVSASAAMALHRALPEAATTGQLVARSIVIITGSVITLLVVDRVARRFLPLAALMQLTLVFPDQTPSRFRTALKAGSGRRLIREVQRAQHNGLADEPDEAATQLVLLATAISDHDRRTRGHSERVRLYAELIGEELQMSPDERTKLQWAALIHDIGKINVPPEILNKKGKPDPTEWAILQRHPADGEELARPLAPWLGEWVHAVGGHHERYDGTGYPRGLAGAQIPRSAAIVAVADSFEVMTAVRSYKKAMPLADARAELTRCTGSHFDPEIVRAFLNISIGRIRRAMGLLGSLVHVPFIGRLTTAATYGPDAVGLGAQAFASTATSGLGAAALTTAILVSPTGGVDPHRALAAGSAVTDDAVHLEVLPSPTQPGDPPASPSSPTVSEPPTTTTAPLPLDAIPELSLPGDALAPVLDSVTPAIPVAPPLTDAPTPSGPLVTVAPIVSTDVTDGLVDLGNGDTLPVDSAPLL